MLWLASVTSAQAGALSTSSRSTTPYDAFINMGNGPYPVASTLTTGGAAPWYDSSQISKFFGGQPTAQQQTAFTNAIMQDVQQTFRLSGVPVALTDNPNAPANHTLSLVSNTSSLPFPNAIGTTDIGGSGYSFIDQEAKSAQNLNQLEWIVAHNISHELMLAFGVGENYDQTGNYIDGKAATWSMIINPNSTFSPAAARALNLAHLDQHQVNTTTLSNAQTLTSNASTVPEPATIAIWGLGALGVALKAYSTKRRNAR